jgi:hypothetical protein
MAPIYYRVVRRDWHMWPVSPWASAPYIVEHPLGEWVTAPVGGLFVYDSLPVAALAAARRSSRCEIWRVDVEDPVPLPGRRARLPNDYAACWDGTLPRRYRLGWDAHTAAFRRIRLVARVVTRPESRNLRAAMQ